MTVDDEKPEVAEEVAGAKPRIAPLVLVSMLLGFLLCLAGVGAYVGYTKNRALNAELSAVRDEIKKKDALLSSMQAQVEALSQQIGALKENSIARSRSNGNAVRSAPQGDLQQAAPPAASMRKTAEEPPEKKRGNEIKPGEALVPAKEKLAKPGGQDCDLVGKSPEQQAETLKRCVSVMDSLAEPPRSGAGRVRQR